MGGILYLFPYGLYWLAGWGLAEGLTGLGRWANSFAPLGYPTITLPPY